MNANKLTVGNLPVCEIVATFIDSLIQRGFVILNNGDYEGLPDDEVRPIPDALFFRLQSPVKLETLDLTEYNHYMARIGSNNTYMCECHYHLIRLESVA